MNKFLKGRKNKLIFKTKFAKVGKMILNIKNKQILK